MPNKCTGCGKLHEDDAEYLITKGCDKCGSRFFFYVRPELIAEATDIASGLSKSEVKEIESDIRDIVSEDIGKKTSKDETVILDVESIRVIKPGKYKIDVTKLFANKPIVIRLGEGKYKIDLSRLVEDKD